MDKKAHEALERIRKDVTLTTSDIEELAPGTEIVVLPGERVPIDSLLSGTGDVDFDTSAITGESVPRTYHPGQEILSGMIPVDKRIEATTLRPFAPIPRLTSSMDSSRATATPSVITSDNNYWYYDDSVTLSAIGATVSFEW